MSAAGTYRIFLSAVTGELGSYRAEVARVLRRTELEVREQEHFRQGPATLLEQLQAYIEQCDAVIVLAGERCGAFPTAEHVAALGPIPVFDAYCRSTGQTRASYTQWELLLAKHYGKAIYLFLSGPGFAPDEPNSEDAGLQTCQAAYRQWILVSGKHYDPLTTKEKLVEDVLVLRFPGLRAPKPIALPYASLGDLFHGREGMLAHLRERLAHTPAGRAAAIAGKAVHGLGGVGKTRLAVEYAWRHAAEYSALLFVGAGSPADLRRNLAALCEVLDLPERQATEEEVRERAALGWLGENPGWLLILDNVDSEDAAAAVDALVARLHGGHVLLTGRLARWSAEVEPIELDVLAEEAAVRFLLARTAGRRRKTKEDSAQALALARELGFLPLALEQAGAYIAEHRLTFASYLEEWQARRDQVLAWFDPRVSHYPASVAVTWQTSVDRLSAPARRLLARLAWLGPEPIPETLLEVPVPGLSEPEAEPGPAPRDALAELEIYSLVTRSAEAPTVTVHRLVQDVTRRSQQADPADGPLAEALHWVNAAFEGDPLDVRTWPTLDPLAPHARAVVAFADENSLAEPTSRLMNLLGQFLDTKALHAEAEPLLRRAIEIAENSLGTEHPDLATILNSLAHLLQATNRFAEAEPPVRRALAIDEKSFGTEHPNIARDLISLAYLLQGTNRYAEAEPLLRRAIKIDEKNFGTDHPKVARDLNNLAWLLKSTNRLAEAEPLMRRALAIDEESFGKEHPEVATDLNNLALLLQATNRLGEAEPLMRRALEIDEKSFGADHPYVAIRLNNLAQLLQDTNRLAEAEPLMRRALAIFLEFGRRTGHQHRRTETVTGNYRSLLQAMGKSPAEIEAAIEALAPPPG